MVDQVAIFNISNSPWQYSSYGGYAIYAGTGVAGFYTIPQPGPDQLAEIIYYAKHNPTGPAMNNAYNDLLNTYNFYSTNIPNCVIDCAVNCGGK